MSTTAQAVTLDSQNNIKTVDFDQHVQQQHQQNAPGEQPANFPLPEVLMAQMREELDRLKGENQISRHSSDAANEEQPSRKR